MAEVDYPKTIFYKICCRDTSIEDIYVGHTANLIKREQSHKSHSKKSNTRVYVFIREYGNWENWQVVPIEEKPSMNKFDCDIRERYWIKELKASLNQAIPGRTLEEYLKEEPEKYAASQIKWRKANKGKIADWNKIYSKKYPERLAAASKRYHKKHPGRGDEASKRYRKKHPERVAANRKKRREADPEKTVAENKKYRNTDPYECDCGSTIQENSKSSHFRTVKHRNYLASLEDDEENSEKTVAENKKYRTIVPYECDCGSTIQKCEKYSHFRTVKHRNYLASLKDDEE
uniref:GIY-YIG catalytic domain protein n=1 Tax=Marseillevirus LCMAC101 TaxID=2506602 RepID=A0A481YT75_9VIRU|nr:MAG: GIY-YIG catalytic domain protein [Marseillevirus LCMAC101]